MVTTLPYSARGQPLDNNRPLRGGGGYSWQLQMFDGNSPILQIINIIIIVINFVVILGVLPTQIAVAEVTSLQKGGVRVIQVFDEMDTCSVADPEGDVWRGVTCGRSITCLQAGAGLTMAPWQWRRAIWQTRDREGSSFIAVVVYGPLNATAQWKKWTYISN